MRVHQKRQYSHTENASSVRYICELWTHIFSSPALFELIQEHSGEVWLSVQPNWAQQRGHPSGSNKVNGVLCKWFWRLFSVGIDPICRDLQNRWWPRAGKKSQNTSTEFEMRFLLNQNMSINNMFSPLANALDQQTANCYNPKVITSTLHQAMTRRPYQFQHPYPGMVCGIPIVLMLSNPQWYGTTFQHQLMCQTRSVHSKTTTHIIYWVMTSSQPHQTHSVSALMMRLVNRPNDLPNNIHN